MGWKKEFGKGYRPPEAILRLVESGLAEDLSWGNDASPSFGFTFEPDEDTHAAFVGDTLAVRIWVQHPNRTKREYPREPRYIVDRTDDMGTTKTFETDDAHLAVSVYLDWLKAAGFKLVRRR